MPDSTDTNLKKCFDSFDGNNNGVLEFSEIANLIEKLGVKMPPEEVQNGFNKIDTNNNGLIDFKEFAAWCGEL